MRQFIARTWNGLQSVLYRQTLLILTLLFCIGVGVALSNMSRLSSHLIASQALQNAAAIAQTMKEARTLYSSQAVNRIENIPGIRVTHDYATQEGAMPLPATFLLELGHKISDDRGGMSAHLFSDYPFPWRRETGGARDNFQRESLSYLRQHPDRSFYRIETLGDRQFFRYAQADIMQPSCVECHNTHPASPKTDWKVGDVRGILEIYQPLNPFIAQTQTGLQSTFLMLGGLSVLALSGLTVVINRLRQTATVLERRVKERTSELALANQDLEKRNQLIRQVFGRYLSDEVVANLLDSPSALKLGGDRRKITILTSDLRGFTALSERLSPEEVVEILNFYLKHMADIITQYEGTINEFMGDGILVFFGAPTVRGNDADRAVACALAMQLQMKAVNDKIKEFGWLPLEMGIGMNTGEVVVGNIGSEKRTKYGVVGSHMNLTFRIESYTTGSQVFISESTLNEVKARLRIDEEKKVKPKGVKREITIYQVGGIGEPYNLSLPQEAENFYPLPEPLPIHYALLEGKQVGENYFHGSLIQLSEKGAAIQAQTDAQGAIPSALSNIKLNLISSYYGLLKSSEDIYAKVLEISGENGCFYIRFTAQPPDVRDRLNSLYNSIQK
ncbi:adenylate/guanylate cyclase domain-containing protein [Phormidium sp. CCY1219]|uniref:adenylate/guanylate cyclase domain-containing protein n=1 Tax=Phormidium sp. CCY1219 TaxID=2886104 RepID=UPI002D1EBC02|nr:adenylate/guanylate cyclase domain-containing protein [Phormidium sp. CCY1219]MEB3828844.1 adenylate/guanylate cyclase domain-containing protein [Phormidium sp. CCY1219]